VLGRDFIHVAVGIQKKFFGLPQRQMCASTWYATVVLADLGLDGSSWWAKSSSKRTEFL
jgi:hypothetical protein